MAKLNIQQLLLQWLIWYLSIIIIIIIETYLLHTIFVDTIFFWDNLLKEKF